MTIEDKGEVPRKIKENIKLNEFIRSEQGTENDYRCHMPNKDVIKMND